MNLIVIAPNEKILSIRKILKCIEDCHNKYKEVLKDWFIVQSVADLEKCLHQVESKCKIIEEKVNRPETKVFFFGKTSVGKSKIINAMLGTDLLISVNCHSTCCFVHLKKSCNSDWLIKYRGREEKCNDIADFKLKLKNLTNSHDLNNENNLYFEESVECFVVINNENKMFENNTEIIDCPGSSNKQEITKCINQHSLDADIFVFVVKDNITDEDRMFFEYQSDQSTKPDIFILVNACDIGDGDDREENNKSLANIKEQCRRFLQKHYDKDEDIDKRIFMISAKEMLNIRMKKKEIKEKQKERCEEFENFENYIANYIADPIKNKLRRHEKDISTLSDDVKNAFEIFSENINNQRSDFILRNYQRKIDALELLKQKISKNCENFKLDMQGNLTKMIDVVDLFDLDVVNNEIKNRYKHFDKQILRFAASQGDEISVFLKLEDLNKSFDDNWKNKMKSLWNASSKMKSLLKKDDNYISKMVARVLSVIPIASIIATNIAISRTDEVDLNNEKFRKDYIKELNSEVQLMNEKAEKIMVDNTDIIKKEIHSNIDNIRTIFADKMKSFDNYWKEINDYLIRCKSILVNVQ